MRIAAAYRRRSFGLVRGMVGASFRRSNSTRSGNTIVARTILGHRRGSIARRHAHSSPTLLSNDGARRRSVAHMSNEPPIPINDPGGRDGGGVLRDPALLLRSSEGDQYDRRRDGRDRAGEFVIEFGWLCEPLFRDRGVRADDMDPHTREPLPPPVCGAFGHPLSAADECDDRIPLGTDPNQRLGDLDAGPASHASAGPQGFHQRHAGTVGQGQVG